MSDCKSRRHDLIAWVLLSSSVITLSLLVALLWMNNSRKEKFLEDQSEAIAMQTRVAEAIQRDVTYLRRREQKREQKEAGR